MLPDGGRGDSAARSGDPARAPDAAEIAARIALRRKLGGGVLSLDVEDLVRILPHRPPLLLLDQVLALVPRQHAVARKLISGDEAGLAARRTGFVFPATLVAEALAQLAGLVAAGISVPEEAAGRSAPWPELAALETLEVHRELDEPAVLDLTVSRLEPVVGDDPAELRFAGEATIAGVPYVTTTLILRIP